MHPTSPSSLLHRTAFLSDPADGSLYLLGAQKQQGLMVCFLQCLGVRGEGWGFCWAEHEGVARTIWSEWECPAEDTSGL